MVKFLGYFKIFNVLVMSCWGYIGWFIFNYVIFDLMLNLLLNILKIWWLWCFGLGIIKFYGCSGWFRYDFDGILVIVDWMDDFLECGEGWEGVGWNL